MKTDHQTRAREDCSIPLNAPRPFLTFVFLRMTIYVLALAMDRFYFKPLVTRDLIRTE